MTAESDAATWRIEARERSGKTRTALSTGCSASRMRVAVRTEGLTAVIMNQRESSASFWPAAW